jgi:hypothetical protein
MTKRKVKLGKPIRWTDEQLDQLSTITDADIEAAAAWWQAYAPRRLKNLLNATEDTANAGTD